MFPRKKGGFCAGDHERQGTENREQEQGKRVIRRGGGQRDSDGLSGSGATMGSLGGNRIVPALPVSSKLAQIQEEAVRGFDCFYQAMRLDIKFFLADTFSDVISVSLETVLDTRWEQFRRTAQRRAGSYRRR